MKLNKRQTGLIIGLVCVVLLILLLLSMCSGRDGGVENTPVQPEETTGTMAATEQPGEETTEATEETTEATEETTEATEETTEPTTGGNTKPGGTTGYNPGTGSGNTNNNNNNNQGTTTEKAPAAGSVKSPYTETVSAFPDSVSTVTLPKSGTIYYNLNLNDESVATYGQSLLTIEDPDAYVIYTVNGTAVTYKADSTGVVSVPLMASTEADTPVSLQIGSSKAKAVVLNFNAPLGTIENPKAVTEDAEGKITIKTSLAAEDKDGYYYQFAAADDGIMELQLDSVTEGVDCDVIVTVGEKTMTLSSTQLDGEEEAEKSGISIDFKKDDVVTVQVLAKAAADGTYPAAEVAVSGCVDYYGSKTLPIEITDAFTSKEIPSGAEVFYKVTGLNGKVLTIAGEVVAGEDGAEDTLVPTTANVKLYNAEGDIIATCEPDESGNVAVKIPNGTDSWLVSIGNAGEAGETYDVTFPYPAGNVNNKATLVVKNVNEEETGSNTAVIEEGDKDVYWFTWTNEVDEGLLSIQMPEEGNWMYSIVHTSGETTVTYDAQYSDGEPQQCAVNLNLSYNDVVDILVSTYDPTAEDAAVAPAGEVSFLASFQTHTVTSATGYTWITLDGGEMINCKQGLKYADGAIMTVEAVLTDDEGNAILDDEGNVTVLTDSSYTINYEGVLYTAQDGVIVVEGIEMESDNPDVFSIANDDDTRTTYRIGYSYPIGHFTNPEPITVGRYAINLFGDGKGHYYNWSTSEPGTLCFTMLSGEMWTYNISTNVNTVTYASTNNGSSTDYEPNVEIALSQEDIAAAEGGTATVLINVGNPSTDPLSEVSVSFELGFYNEKVTEATDVSVAASKTYYLLQSLGAISAEGMTITGEGSFTVAYGSALYESLNGAVTISSGFTTEDTFFQITNNTGTDQTYSISFNMAPGHITNPAEINVTGASNALNLNGMTTEDSYYYSWTAPADGNFAFAIVAKYSWTPWTYEITHTTADGNTETYSDTGVKLATKLLNPSFDVAKGDTVTVKFGVQRAVNSTIEFTATFTEAVAAASVEEMDTAVVVEYKGKHTPEAYELTLGENQMLQYVDLTEKCDELYLDEKTGYYSFTEGGPVILVDFTNDTYVNLAKILAESGLSCEITAEDGTAVTESYSELLEQYMACAKVIELSEEESQTLYPLTEDLMYILKGVGEQLGWYDSTNAGYRFAALTAPEAESLWMFSCCYAVENTSTLSLRPDKTDESPADGQQRDESTDKDTEADSETESSDPEQAETESDTETELDSNAPLTSTDTEETGAESTELSDDEKDAPSPDASEGQAETDSPSTQTDSEPDSQSEQEPEADPQTET